MLQLEFTPYLFPFLLSLCITIGLGLYAARRRRIPANATFAWTMLALSYWTFCYIMELSSVTAGSKLFWASAKYPGAVAAPILWFILAVQLTAHSSWLKRRLLRFVLAAFAVATCLVVFTNNWHHWFWTETQLVAGEPELQALHGFYFFIYASASYLLILGSVLLFFSYYRRTPPLYRRQAALLAIGGFIPLGGRILEDFAGIDIFPHIDNVILLFLFFGLFCALAIFRYNALDMIHIARDMVIQNIGAGIIVLDMSGRVADLNPYAQGLMGENASAAIGKSLDQALPAWKNMDLQNQELRMGEEEQTRYFYVQASDIKNAEGAQAGRTIVLFDITARKRAEQELEHLAQTDALTGVPNYGHFLERATAEFARATRHPESIALLMLDLDHFKELNDTFGHPVADRILKQVATKCRVLVRESDLVARYGGEEFICMLLESTRTGALLTAERIRQGIEGMSVEHNGAPVRVSISIGVAHADWATGTTLQELIQRADQALYQAKAEGRNCVVVWQEKKA